MTEAASDNTMLPDGTEFVSWEQAPAWTRTYHVAQRTPDASDANPGTEAAPWKTIGRAAAVLQPGERVVVHGGVYREWVKPACGGTGPDRMIGYEAARGEDVVLKGSDLWLPAWEPTRDFACPPDTPTGCTRLSADMFEGANVFCLQNYTIQPELRRWKPQPGYELRRGQLFLDGVPLTQVGQYTQLANTDHAFWVEENGMSIHLRLAGNESPAGKTFEITTREQVFAPVIRGLNYIRVSGFRIFHAGNGIPIPPPQRGALSATAGHHWIIEDNEIGHANTIGMDLGGQWWHYLGGDRQGFHVVRRNHVHDCAVVGICAWHNLANESLLVEDNLITDNGRLPVQDHYETGGIKMHYVVNSLIRRNVFLRNRNCAALWLDGLNTNTRVTQNLMHDTDGSSFGACFVEITHGPMLIDNNIILSSSRHGVYEHDAARLMVVQNLIAGGTGAAVYLRRGDPDRAMGDSHPEDDHRLFGNILCGFPSYAAMPNATARSDNNVLGGLKPETMSTAGPEEAEAAQDPTPGECALTTAAPFGFAGERPKTLTDWREAGYDVNSIELPVEVTFREATLELQIKLDDGLSLPDFAPLPALLDNVPPLSKKTAGNMPMPVGHQPGTVMAALSDLCRADFLGRPRARHRLQPGPLENPPPTGAWIKIDPRRPNPDESKS